jgi:regulator of protease activity HflC (stomatin/prohibitin superfamily)
VLGIKLPESIVAAINRKTEQYYLAREYSFRIDRERQEAARKQIEAAGIAAFQRTVTDGISDSYLRWRGIEATLELARSNNAKTVIIGGRDGLPIILGGVDGPAVPAGDSKKTTDKLPTVPSPPTPPTNNAPAAPPVSPSPP